MSELGVGDRVRDVENGDTGQIIEGPVTAAYPCTMVVRWDEAEEGWADPDLLEPEHQVSHGTSTTSVCTCGKPIPSTHAAIEAHMGPLTPSELAELTEADPESDQ